MHIWFGKWELPAPSFRKEWKPLFANISHVLLYLWNMLLPTSIRKPPPVIHLIARVIESFPVQCQPSQLKQFSPPFEAEVCHITDEEAMHSRLQFFLLDSSSNVWQKWGSKQSLSWHCKWNISLLCSSLASVTCIERMIYLSWHQIEYKLWGRGNVLNIFYRPSVN